MKPIYKTAITALLALSSASVALAATTVNVIHVTGSTAYRAADITAEVNWLSGLGSGVTAEYFDTSTGSLNHAAYSVIYGPVVSNVQYVFENYFNGSIGGDESLVAPIALNFPAAASYTGTASAVVLGSHTTASTGGTNFGATSGYAVDSSNPDVAFSDVFFDTATQIINNTDSTSNTLGTPTDRVVGVVPFVFVASGSDSATIAKLSGLTLTPQLVTGLWGKGKLPLSYFTGVTTDNTATAYALGRDIDSGTRATALAEPGYGLNGSGNGTVNATVGQYYPYASLAAFNTNQAASSQTAAPVTSGVVGDDTTATTIGYIGLVGAEDIDDYEMPTGDGGYYSGGNLAAAMVAPYVSTITNTALITYLGVSDAKSALAAQTSPKVAATLLSYNGVKFDPTVVTTANESLIYTGKYTFWGYEHEFYFGLANSAVDTAAAGIQTQLNAGFDQIASAGVTIASMQVGRADDGQAVTTGNPY